eukprot:c15981_g1_i1.p1 GENE.c15981_g1_i1~~c15981_g1_i1.p1  ORF type:complete len:539 (+),score=117.35 c15981_g1_i1:32-1618(+)
MRALLWSFLFVLAEAVLGQLVHLPLVHIPRSYILKDCHGVAREYTRPHFIQLRHMTPAGRNALNLFSPSSNLTCVGGSSTPDNVPMNGSISTIGEYYTGISIGVPPVQFTVQVDSGSVITAIPDQNCLVLNGLASFPCSPPASRYNYTTSDTSERLKCAACPNASCTKDNCVFSVVYGDRSMIQGIIFRDLVRLGSTLAKGGYFGSILEEKTPGGGSFEGDLDGILGLAYRQTEDKHGPPLFDLMVQQNGLRNVFSISIGNGFNPSGGQLTLGGFDPEIGVGDIHYSKITHEALYHVTLKGISVDGKSIGISKFPGTIVDSGTTKLILRTAYREPIRQLLQAACNDASVSDLPAGLCDSGLVEGSALRIPLADLDRYPKIEFTVNGWKGHSELTLTLVGRNYMVTRDNGNTRSFYISFQDDLDVMIFGNVFMTGFATIYDRENGRLGFRAMTQDNSILARKPSYVVFDTLTPLQNILLFIVFALVGLATIIFVFRFVSKSCKAPHRGQDHNEQTRLSMASGAGYGSFE